MALAAHKICAQPVLSDARSSEALLEIKLHPASIMGGHAEQHSGLLR